MSEPEVVDVEAVEVTDADTDPTLSTAMVDPTQVASVPGQEVEIMQERVESQLPANVLPSPQEWKATIAMATEIANTEFVPDAYRGKAASVVAAILVGREIGIGPMAALRQIHMIDGKPSFSAELMMAQLRRGGIRILNSEATMERAYIHAVRQDTGEEASVEWTYVEAQAITYRKKGGVTALLVEKDNWVNYRVDMLWARCVGRLARRLGSDLLNGMVYSSEEIADWDEAETDDYSSSTSRVTAPPHVTHSPLGKSRVDRRKDAPGTTDAIWALLPQIDASVDWIATIAMIVHAWYGGEYTSVRSLPVDERPWFLTRLANLAAILRELTSARGDFPPMLDAEFTIGVARAFDGVTIEKPLPTQAVIDAAEEARAAAETEPDPDPSAEAEETEETVEALLGGLPEVP